MSARYADRVEAGRVLADHAAHWRQTPGLLVLGLPRGGVPVARELARGLAAPLDLLLVRKLGAPGQEELALGAIASGGARVINDGVVKQLGIDEATVERIAERERAELERRERAYRGDRPAPDLHGRTVFLVDDGLATGATMRAAVAAVASRDPERIVVAVPVAPPDTVRRLEGETAETICPLTPWSFGGVGGWYERFDQLTDDAVRAELEAAWAERPEGGA